MTESNQTTCKQCGVCCTKGGPAFHGEDMALLTKGSIPRSNLITIRKGEFAYNPVAGKVEATESEIIKMKGSGGEWACCYYDTETQGCTIYESRPMACGVLQCWNPDASLALVGKNLLTRLEIVAGDELLTKLIQDYESSCPMIALNGLHDTLENDSKNCLKNLEEAVNRDLQFRNRVVVQSAAVLEEELFLFGRPLFQLLQPFGLLTSQYKGRLYLKQKNG